jgi:2-aminoadipate transaminase
MTTLQCFRTHGVSFVAIEQDDQGIRTDLLEQRLKNLRSNGENPPKLLFDVPDFHNPTGITTSQARREGLIALAREYGFVIIEDDPYRRLRFEGEPVPPIKSLDQHGVVVAVGTVSKIMSPGLRIGWAIADPKIIRRMALQKSDDGTSPLNQRIVYSVMRSGKLQEHISIVTDSMREHRDVVIDSIAQQMPGCRVRRASGGYFLWVELPSGVSGDELAARAIEHGVEVTPAEFAFQTKTPVTSFGFPLAWPARIRLKKG